MRRIVLAAAVILMLGLAPDAAAYCYRMSCPTAQTCEANQTSSGGPCCCQVNCEGGPGGPVCSCTTSCDAPCSGSCPGCPCNEAPGGFALTPDLRARIRLEHRLTALVLQNLVHPKTGRVGSTVAEGKATLDGGPDLAYKILVRATKESLIIDYVFEQVGNGPLPDNVRVDVDAAGRALVIPLPEADAERVKTQAGQPAPTSSLEAARS